MYIRELIGEDDICEHRQHAKCPLDRKQALDMWHAPVRKEPATKKRSEEAPKKRPES